MKLFSGLEEAEVWKKFESTRQGLIELVINLPDSIFNLKEVQEWLRDDVLAHIFEHRVVRDMLPSINWGGVGI